MNRSHSYSHYMNKDRHGSITTAWWYKPWNAVVTVERPLRDHDLQMYGLFIHLVSPESWSSCGREVNT